MNRLALLLVLLLALPLALASADEEDAASPWRARLVADPCDGEALLALADHHESCGETGLARRYLRAFLRLVYEHPRRLEAARRAAALRPAVPFLEDEDRRNDGGYLIYRNVIDGTRSVRIPEGPYLRRLRPHHPAGDGRMDVRFEVEVDACLADLHETPAETWWWFILEGGYEVDAWWGDDAAAWREEVRADPQPTWQWLHGRFPGPHRACWPLTFFEARALARSAGKRLPTEAEWEKAARGGVQLGDPSGDCDVSFPNPRPLRLHPWGNEPVEGPGGAYRALAGGFTSNVDPTLDVDALPEGASPYGCLQMLGNIQEWTADWFWWDDDVLGLPQKNPCATSPDPRGKVLRSKVTKGGYFNWGPDSLRIDARTNHTYDCGEMALLFKCGMRAFADAPLLIDDPGYVDDDSEVYVPKPDPMDGPALLEEGLALLARDEEERARNYFRAAARLIRHGALRVVALDYLSYLEPRRVWTRTEGGRWRSEIDGAEAVEVGDLLVDVHEITEGRFLTFLAETDRTSKGWVGLNAHRLGNGDRPVGTLTPESAEAYAAWAHRRLPTRAEWKRLAHVGEMPFPWGPEPVAGRAVVEFSLTEEELDGWDRRRPVGSLPAGASPEGVLDLVGNVAEWCADGPVDEDGPSGDRWLVGGDARFFHDVEDAEDFAESLDQIGYAPFDLQRNAFAGARCVANRPR